MRFFKKKDDRNLMDFIPEKLVQSQTNEENLEVLIVPKFRDFFFGKLLQPKLPEKKAYFRISLDEFGTFVWNLIDGKRTVFDIYKEFEKKYPEEEQSLQRLSRFIQLLKESKFIKYNNV